MIKDIRISVEGLREIVFSGYHTVTLVTDYYKSFRAYDVPNGALLCEGEILPRFDRWLGARWEHGQSLRFATSYSTDGKLVIDIHQLQPSSIPLFALVESFVVPPRDGEFSFSPPSFHAAFVSTTAVTLLDVRGSKTLLQTETPRPFYLLPGHFSPNGDFFACGTLESEIHVWKNTPAGYMPWSSLEPRLPSSVFSFSPTATSILAWGPGGVQLLDNHAGFSSPNKTAPNHDRGDHLVAYSKDGARIATVRRGHNVVTVFDPLSDAPQRSINTAMQILDIRIVGNVVFMADMRELVGWDLEVGEIVHRAFGVLISEIGVTSTDPGIAEHFILPAGCSWVAFTVNMTTFLYGVQDQWVLYKHTMDRDVMDIRSAPHGRQLCFILDSGVFEKVGARGVMLSEMVEQWRVVNVIKDFAMGVYSQDALHGCYIRRDSWWIEDSGGRKLLWLPPSWRMTRGFDMRWNGNFLALADGRHPAPIIIAFQPQPLLPSSSI